MPSQDDAVQNERDRIARDLHDVVGHHLTVVALRAAATAAEPGVPEGVHEALEQIRRSAAGALRDLRRILDGLDSDVRPGPAGSEPLAELDGLISGVASAGLDVDLTLHGAPRPCDGHVSQTAVRIVQEALTNSLRHGRATGGRVALVYDIESLTVEVIDNGRGGQGRPISTRSHRGLQGMQERVAKIRGDLSAGPLPDGGFRVWARLPRTVAQGQVPA